MRPEEPAHHETQVIECKANRAMASSNKRQTDDFYAVPCLATILKPAIALVEFSLRVVGDSRNDGDLMAAPHPLLAHVINPELLRIKILAYDKNAGHGGYFTSMVFLQQR